MGGMVPVTCRSAPSPCYAPATPRPLACRADSRQDRSRARRASPWQERRPPGPGPAAAHARMRPDTVAGPRPASAPRPLPLPALPPGPSDTIRTEDSTELLLYSFTSLVIVDSTNNVDCLLLFTLVCTFENFKARVCVRLSSQPCSLRTRVGSARQAEQTGRRCPVSGRHPPCLRRRRRAQLRPGAYFTGRCAEIPYVCAVSTASMTRPR